MRGVWRAAAGALVLALLASACGTTEGAARGASSDRAGPSPMAVATPWILPSAAPSGSATPPAASPSPRQGAGKNGSESVGVGDSVTITVTDPD